MPATLAWGVFEAPAAPAPDEAERVKARQAARLLRATNRLIRWYRAVAREAEAAEVTRAQASPFRFNLVAGYAPWGSDPELRFEVTFLHVPATRSGDEIRRAVREGLGSGEDPPVADLLLLDAERFREAGRFREAVLFCWSTIDATFNRKYEQLVEARLAGEWGDAVNFFTGVTFGMRNKMTAALFLLANTSLFRVLGEAGWERLSNSYRKRNGIIHRTESSTVGSPRRRTTLIRRSLWRAK